MLCQVEKSVALVLLRDNHEFSFNFTKILSLKRETIDLPNSIISLKMAEVTKCNVVASRKEQTKLNVSYLIERVVQTFVETFKV